MIQLKKKKVACHCKNYKIIKNASDIFLVSSVLEILRYFYVFEGVLYVIFKITLFCVCMEGGGGGVVYQSDTCRAYQRCVLKRKRSCLLAGEMVMVMTSKGVLNFHFGRGVRLKIYQI